MKRSHYLGALVGLCAFLATPLCGQNIIQVSGGGNALENAAQGAPPGSVFVVQPGRYGSFAWTPVDATIVAPQRATLVGGFSVSASSGSLAMAGIDIVGGTRNTPYGSYSWPGRIYGTVDLVLNDCTAQGLSASRCTVAVAGCRFGADESTTVSLNDADAVITDTTIIGGIFFSYYGPFSYALNAMSINSSTVRMERVSVSATSLGGGGVPGAGTGVTVTGITTLTVADSVLAGGPAGSGFPAGSALSVQTPASVKLSSTTTTGGVTGSHQLVDLATARFTNGTLTLGSALTARFDNTPNTPLAVLFHWDLAAFSSPLISEPLFALGTTNFTLISSGISNPQGHFWVFLNLPNDPSLRYQRGWLTALFAGTLPLRSTAPIGGILR